MLYNAEQLLTRVRQRLKDPSGASTGTQWSDAELLMYLNESQESLVSKVIESGEDFFGTFKDFDFTAGQNEIPLFDGFLFLRAVTFIGQAGAEPQQMIESRLVEGVEGSAGIASATESQYFYAIYGDNMELAPTPGDNLASAGRAFFIRCPGPILYQIPAAFGGSTLTFGSDAPVEADLYVDTYVDVTLGTGAGQRRKISAYTAGRVATVTSAFSPALGVDSKIATVSRLPALFQRNLVLGAAVRAKIDNEENATGLVALANEAEEELENFIEKRDYAQRSVVPFDPDDGI